MLPSIRDGARRSGESDRQVQVARFSTFDSLSIRDYRLLWMGQLSTSMGQWMDQVTRGFLIYGMTGSPFLLGATMAARGVPLLFFGVIAGAFADRSGRKAQLIIAQATNAVLNTILGVLVLTGLVQPWHVLVTAFMAGTVQAFQQPARQTLISDIVGNDKLMNALALNSMAVNSSRIIGPSISGVFYAAVGPGYSYIVQAGMYAFATVWTGQMRVPTRASDTGSRPREPFFRSIMTGFAFVARERDIRTLMILALGPLTLGMSYTSLMPVIAQDVLHGDARTGAVLLSCIGAGALVGALVVGSMRRSHAYGLPVVIGASMFGLSLLGFSTSTFLWLSCLFGVALGAFNLTYTTQNQTLLQVLTPPDLRGRVMSIYLLNRGLVPASALFAGALASAFGGPAALRVSAILVLCVVGAVVASAPNILRLTVPLTSDDLERGRGRRGRAAAPEGDLAAVPSGAREP